MTNISYINGEYCYYENAKTHINDRGYHFGDAVYEVIVFNEKSYFDYDEHINRLFRSLQSIDITLLYSSKSLKIIIKNLIKINKAKSGSIYLQVSRGIANRNHSYKNLNLKPVLVIIVSEKKNNLIDNINGVKTITCQDNRWSRPDIKTTQLLPNILAKTKADKNGAYEAIFIDNKDFVTEGSSSNIWIINKDNEIITRDLDGKILSGITRKTISIFAENKNINVIERKFSKKELMQAKEVFLTSATSFVTPIIEIDGHVINDGLVGNISNQLRHLYLNNIGNFNHKYA